MYAYSKIIYILVPFFFIFYLRTVEYFLFIYGQNLQRDMNLLLTSFIYIVLAFV